MAAAAFYDACADEKLVITLFNGWGYNFYRAENQLRADDLMVRAQVSEMLGAARAGVEAAEAAFRREHLPPPSRERPRPDPAAVLRAHALEVLGGRIGALEGQIRALPVPETDRMTQRLRDERATLEALLQADRAMVAGAARLRGLLSDGRQESDESVEPLLSELRHAIQARRDLLDVCR